MKKLYIVLLFFSSCMYSSFLNKKEKTQEKFFKGSLLWKTIPDQFRGSAFQKAVVLKPVKGFNHTEVVGFRRNGSDTMNVSMISNTTDQVRDEFIQCIFTKSKIISAVISNAKFIDKKPYITNEIMDQKQFDMFLDSTYRILCPK